MDPKQNTVLIINEDKKELQLIDNKLEHIFNTITYDNKEISKNILHKNDIQLILTSDYYVDDILNLRENFSRFVPIVVLSSNSSDQYMVELLSKGIDDCFEKNYNEKILFAKLNAIINRLS